MQQLDLFHNGPEGFEYHPDFLSEQEEVHLLELITGYQLVPFIFKGYQALRKTLSFGYRYNFENGSLEKGNPIPSELLFLIEKLASHLKMAQEVFEQVLVTEYPSGAVINWHRDAPPFKVIAGISLLSDCRFRFRPYDKNQRSKKTIAEVYVEPRSLYVIKGSARSDWQHSTAPVKHTRFSITMRSIRY